MGGLLFIIMCASAWLLWPTSEQRRQAGDRRELPPEEQL